MPRASEIRCADRDAFVAGRVRTVGDRPTVVKIVVMELGKNCQRSCSASSQTMDFVPGPNVMRLP